MEITSAAFAQGSPIPRKHTGQGEDQSPPLSFSGVPAKAVSLALVMDDPDAPSGTWVHWVIYDLPAKAPGLPQALTKNDQLSDGAKQGLAWGVDSFSRVGYYGPFPPPGRPHRYFFRLYALDRRLDLAPRATAGDLRKAMEGHVLEEAHLMGIYGR